MATVVLQFQVNAGAVSTGVATVVAEDEVDLRLASYSGLQSIRYEIQAFPAGFAQPTGWSTDGSSGAYYFNASPIVGLTPPTITMPTSAEISAGQWGKWIFRAIGTTASTTITSDPRCGVKIVSPSLGLNGIAFSEEDEFDAARAYPGELQEDLVEIDAAAIVSGGFVSSLAATAPIKVDAATGAVTASWLATGNVTMSGYGWTSCSSVTNAGGALALTAGGGAASLAGSTTATVSANGGALLCEGATTTTITAGTALAMTGATTAAITATAGALSCTGGTTAALTASSGTATITSSTEVNVSPLLNVRRNDATANTTLDVATLRRTTSDAGFGQTGIGGRLAFELEDSAGNADVAGTIAVDYLDATSTSEDARILFRAQVAGTLTDSLSLRGTTIRAHGLAGSGSGFVAVDNNGDFSYSAGAGASATEYYLVNAGSTALANGVPIQAIAATVQFNSSTVMPLSARRVDAADDSTALDVFSVLRAGPGTAANGIGANVRIVLDNADGDAVDAALLTTTFTDVTAASEDAKFAISLASGGSLSERLTLDSLGALAVDSTVTGTGFIGTSWDTATATTATIGAANMTALTVTPSTTFGSTVTELRPGITTTVTPGIIASNATAAATPSPLVQYGPAFISSGGAWETGGGGSAKTVRGGFYTRGISSGTAGAEVVFVYDTGGGTFSEGGRITTNLPGVGGVGFVAPTLVCDGGNGIRFVSSSTDRGNVKWSGSAIEVNAGSNPITLSSTSGTTIDTQASTLRVLSVPSTPASAAAAVTIDLSRQNAEHTITENTTVTFSNASLGESGIVIFIQDGTGRTITMPAASGSIEYIDSIETLTVTGIVDTTAATKTILKYYVMTGPKILFYYRATSAT